MVECTLGRFLEVVCRNAVALRLLKDHRDVQVAWLAVPDEGVGGYIPYPQGPVGGQYRAVFTACAGLPPQSNIT